MDELEHALDSPITNQIDFCGWWRENVRSQGRPENVTDTVTIFAEEAERLTGFSKMQVSRWRKTLGASGWQSDVTVQRHRVEEAERPRPE